MMLFKVMYRRTPRDTLELLKSHQEAWHQASVICCADVCRRIPGSHHGMQGRVCAWLTYGSALGPAVL
jgi:hypothetical protein